MSVIDDLFSLAGKTALVTGGATGIGRMAATGLAGAGARVLIASRKGEMCEVTAQEINALGLPGKVEGFAGDVGAEIGIEALAKEVEKRTGALHILMNNAGTTWGKPYGEFPHSAWEKVMSVNVAGLFSLTQRLTPLLAKTATLEDPARVVNVGSVMGTAPIGVGAYSYSASKGAVHHLTKILATELADKRITVNAIAPGPFQSNMTAFATADAENRDRIGAKTPLGRIGMPDDIAGLMVFLGSKAGAYVTGAIIPTDGGIHVETVKDLF
ncbi:SDR family oxidoreductase [Pikeienuella piscinae]|uniref:SDR family oxidoreductase n=1 Tax=Pikeienuella piscinae TaxID=2748098 RepID=A0A7L5C2F8_9RHOB|nr:SDR family oxidoreductase [Pikeienuella piscinae]QIE56374.1 SDR family oxidoreductase [Pikeienuella piscinae]